MAHRLRPESLASASSLRDMWSVTDKALVRFLAVAGERPLTIWYLPAWHEWDEQRWQLLKGANGRGDADRFLIRDLLQNWAGQNGVTFVDLTPLLRHWAACEVKFPVDGHWKAEGHRIVAEGLAGNPESCRRLGRGASDEAGAGR